MRRVLGLLLFVGLLTVVASAQCKQTQCTDTKPATRVATAAPVQYSLASMFFFDCSDDFCRVFRKALDRRSEQFVSLHGMKEDDPDGQAWEAIESMPGFECHIYEDKDLPPGFMCYNLTRGTRRQALDLADSLTPKLRNAVPPSWATWDVTSTESAILARWFGPQKGDKIVGMTVCCGQYANNPDKQNSYSVTITIWAH